MAAAADRHAPGGALAAQDSDRPVRRGDSRRTVREAGGSARLFLAIWPSGDEVAALDDYQRRWSWPAAAARVRSERIHLTLHFIGTVPRPRLPEIGAGLAVGLAPCELALTRAAIWSRGLAVLLAPVVPGPLGELHTRLGEALRTLGLPTERRAFLPHVTLARSAAGALPPEDPPALRWQVGCYALVETVAGGGYAIRQRYG
ncbi:2'-5' RNA ligase family protein [Accumulibacter sp.]|uniref:2'-5' RNA ligase family protein n=1 Tax=Accumulibacter sp. TaxID=2053492 RepID=UPI0025E1B98B|nr:2'-5' RNA ligase family protein [Accumulibacter sp.]MCM8596470.1 RNA 2',3'-cyclic phosphodiesterase [Accumulibacter sp.]MCM8627358.1 RNA 2',3'-cyclic phosphodiesterase [Accumulibacter sp.]MDS4050618.1 2'-5' RNA ligase family protein [Accumulibacter sp.]